METETRQKNSCTRSSEQYCTEPYSEWLKYLKEKVEEQIQAKKNSRND